MDHSFGSILFALPVLLAAGVGLHWLLSRAGKALVSAVKPLALGEPDAAGYERQVYHTADPEMLKVVLIALCSGALAWVAFVSGWNWLWAVALLVVAAAVAFDLWVWERVSGSASYVWFQRGLSGTVHQLAIENIRDLEVEEEEASGFTLRNLVPGRRNSVCRLRLRLQERRVVVLPKTDAVRGLVRVEALANHVRLRQQQAADRQALTRSSEDATRAAQEAAVAESTIDRELAAELKRLRRGALAPDAPPMGRKSGEREGD